MKKNNLVAGFSMIEVLLSVLVVSIALLGLVKLMNQNQKSVVDEIEKLNTQAAAEKRINEIRGMTLGDLVLLNGTSDVFTTFHNKSYTRKMAAGYVSLENNRFVASHTPTARVRVTVSAFGSNSTGTVTSILYQP